MALPEKGSRSIIVDGIKYRWCGFATRAEGDDQAEVLIELFDEPRQKLKALFSWTKLHKEYKKVNQKLSVYADHPPPYVVQQTILYGLMHGWEPDKRGGVIFLGNLNEELDFSMMKEQ